MSTSKGQDFTPICKKCNGETEYRRLSATVLILCCVKCGHMVVLCDCAGQ